MLAQYYLLEDFKKMILKNKKRVGNPKNEAQVNLEKHTQILSFECTPGLDQELSSCEGTSAVVLGLL